jgi:hypothetical protein
MTDKRGIGKKHKIEKGDNLNRKSSPFSFQIQNPKSKIQN